MKRDIRYYVDTFVRKLLRERQYYNDYTDPMRNYAMDMLHLDQRHCLAWIEQLLLDKQEASKQMDLLH